MNSTSGGLFYGQSNLNQTSLKTMMKSYESAYSIFVDTTKISYALILASNNPLPIQVAVIDASIDLFGRLFACVPIRHRVQIMDHFADCIKLTKSVRQEAVQVNVFAALLSAMKHLTKHKTSFGDDSNLKKSVSNLIFVSKNS